MLQAQLYDWPGNVRELKNHTQQSILLSENGIIKEFNLPSQKRTDLDNDVRKNFIALVDSGISPKLIQKTLGLPRSTFYRWKKDFDAKGANNSKSLIVD